MNSSDFEPAIDHLYRQMLRDYAAISAKRSGALAATALRHKAPSYRDIMAFEATGNTYTYEELKSAVTNGEEIKSAVTSILRLGALGRVVLLQDTEVDDREIGQELLRLVISWLSRDKATQYRYFLIQFYILNQCYKDAADLLAADSGLDRTSHKHLHTDLLNPFIRGDDTDEARWLRGFNIPFRKFNLSPIAINKGTSVPFDGLRSQVPGDRESTFSSDKLVSVIFTSFQPERDAFFNAVSSVLNQTWKNLEVIIVNDSSGSEYESIFEEIAELDHRVRVITTERNGGTYLARNLGFGIAQGDYLTGHDDDDWSHPQRLETQVAFLEHNQDLAGCRVHSIACDENLALTRLGKATPEERNASTLMVTRETWQAVGGFLPVRKAGDTELYLRIERLTQRKVADLQVPLTVIRKAAGSLSNAEFQTGWNHPARRSFKAAYAHWHQNASDQELRLGPHAALNLDIPHRFQTSDDEDPQHFDVILVGDWHPLGGPQRSMLEEIKALLLTGKRIGIMHLEPARFMSSKERPLSETILELINTGQVTNVLYDDPATADLLVLRYPPIMQFPPAVPTAVRANKMIILANQAPEEVDGRDIRYIPSLVHKNSVEIFGSEVMWVPQSAMIRERLKGRLPDDAIAEFDMPGILNVDEWFVERKRFRSALPVVGRHSRDDPMKWPERQAHLRAAYPVDGTFDVRFLGGGRTPLRVLKRSNVPGTWTVYGKDQINPQAFLATLDFYVFFQHSKAVEAFGRSILEAVASGMVVILEEKFRVTFGDAALYARPEQVVDLVRKLHQDKTKYDAQVEAARRFVNEHFSYKSYTKRIEQLLEEAHETLI